MCESKEFSLLDLHNSSGNVVLAKFVLGFIPSDLVVCKPHGFGVIPPDSSGSYQIVCRKWNLVDFFDASNF